MSICSRKIYPTCFAWLAILFALVGCSQPQPPVVNITATPLATANSREQTIATATPNNTSTAVPTSITTPIPATTEPTASPSPTETAVATLLNASNQLTIDFPLADEQATIGKPLEVYGQSPTNGVDSVMLALAVGGHVLMETAVPINSESGIWSTVLDIPHTVSGPAWLTAVTPNQELGQALYLQADTNYRPPDGQPFIRPFRPSFGQTAVSGYPLYFAGEASAPIDNQITIGLLVGPACSRFAAQQPITLNSGVSSTSLSWNGLIILPRGLGGQQACAVAYTGTFGIEGWQGELVPLNIVPAEDVADEDRIMLESATGLAFLAGEQGRISGTAVNAANLNIAIKDPPNDNVLSEGKTAVGDFGFWEINLPVPTEAPNTVDIEITILNEDETPPIIYRTTANIIR